MMKFARKTVLFVLLMLASVLVFSSCSLMGSRLGQLGNETSRDEKAFRGMLGKVSAAFDSHDSDGLKSLFAANAIKENPGLDDQIAAFFMAYEGPMEIEDRNSYSISSSEHVDHGKRKTNMQNMNDVVIDAGGVRYCIRIEMCSRDDFDKDNEGLQTLNIATSDARESRYFVWYSSWTDGPGLYYQDSAETRDDIRWIEGAWYKYTPTYRALTAESLRAVVEWRSNFSNLLATVGEPNCFWTEGNYDRYYYELDNGVFAVFQLDKNIHPDDPSGQAVRSDSIVAVYTADERSYIETIWMADDIVRVRGYYHCYSPVARELNEDYFWSFVQREGSFDQLTSEIGSPNIVKQYPDFYSYYELPDGRFVGCDYRDSGVITEVMVADSESMLYMIWKAGAENA